MTEENHQHTKEQLKRFFQKAVEKAQNPDQREILKRKRQEKKEKVARRFGL